LKTEKEPGEVNEIDEEKSEEEKTSSDNDSDLNDKESSNNITGDKDTLVLQKNVSVIQSPVMSKNSGTIQIPGGKSSGPTSPINNILNNTGSIPVHN
jgi:hypothetical protein